MELSMSNAAVASIASRSRFAGLVCAVGLALAACTGDAEPADEVRPGADASESDASAPDDTTSPPPDDAADVPPSDDAASPDASEDPQADVEPTPDDVDSSEVWPDDTTEPGDGGTADTGLPESYAGEWVGTWQAEGILPLSGSFVLLLEEHEGAEVEGEATFTGAPCFSFAFVDALIEDGEFSADLYDDEISITIVGTISATQLVGRFEAVDAGFCSGYVGVIEATRLLD
jgi:hypothetical protein